MAKWFDLRDEEGAKLKLASINGVTHVFVMGLSTINPKTTKCVNLLNFNRVPNKRYLVRRVNPDERLTVDSLRRVFPRAQLVDMAQSEYLISQSTSSDQNKNERVDLDLKGMRRLGRNAQSNLVYESPSGRFVLLVNGQRRMESPQSPTEVLRLNAPGQAVPQDESLKRIVLELASGFVSSMDAGEVQHSEDYVTWRDAIFAAQYETIGTDPKQVEVFKSDINELLFSAIDAALIRHVAARHDVAVDAYGPMARLYDYLPPYMGAARGLSAIPQPLNVAAQRLLGDTTGKTVLYPQAYDGASFAFLPEGTHIRACQSGRDFDVFRTDREDVSWVSGYSPVAETGADAMFFNMDPLPGRDEYRIALQAVRSLSVGARAILVFSSDDDSGSGKLANLSARFLQTLARNHTVDDLFETAPILSRKAGATRGLRVFVVRNIPADDVQAVAQQERVKGWLEHGIGVISSWNEVKTHVDEIIAAVDLREAQSKSVQIERAMANEGYQKPYVSFSKLGEARTMSPSNLQASAQSYLTRLEQVYGPVDDFVSRELGMGHQTMAQRFSPEQIDASAIMISRYLVDRSSILADDTGLGKGRALASVATWANKRGMNVVFVTDRANLFSDLARDLNDIGEWDRFRPLVVNADGEITVDDGPGGAPRLLATGAKPDYMRQILDENLSLEQTQSNIAFLTYSQISGKDSIKAQWIKGQLSNALLIFDEAHIAAGSDSNIATHVSEMASLAKHVQFASATWAKTHDNLHIYQRALPASVSVATLTETMRKGGDSFSEIFSTMLSAEGALIRREHDLSKLEVEMVIDEVNIARNEMVSDKVADVLGSAAFISGEMQQVFIRSNADSVNRIKAARDVRARSVKANIFSSSFGGGSVIYQVMKSVQGALNSENVANIAIKSLERGFKPVIVTDATSESLVNQLVEEMKKDRLDRLGPLASDAANQDIEIAAPTLRDMLRLVVLKRLSMVKVQVLTLDDVEEDAPAESDIVEDDDDAADAAVPVPVPVAADVPAPAADDPLEDVTEAALVPQPVTAQTDVLIADVLQATEIEEEIEPVVGVKRKQRVYKEVSILDMDDIPAAARAIYAKGLQEMMEKINAVPAIEIVGIDVMARKMREAGARVSELTGRKNMLMPVEGSNLHRLVPRVTSKRAVKATIRGFNSGDIDALIINRAVAAGVSMHASPRFIDQRRRHLIEHQIPEDPVVRVQLLGRVNRFDQVSSPLITTASSGIFGEVRYLMMQNRKLARMSANVRSSRDNAMLLKGVTDMFNVVGKSAVRGFLLDNPLISRRLGITEHEIDQSPDIVNRLTMFIPMLLVSQQRMVYDDLYARFDEILVRAELDGENPLRPHELNVRARTESEVMFFGDDSADVGMISAFDAPVMARKIAWVETLNPLKYDAVLEAAKISIERLKDKGYLVMKSVENRVTNVTKEVPAVHPDLVKKLVDAYHGLTRLAHMATGEQEYNASIVNHAAAKRTYIKYDWFKNNLEKLVPGSRIVIQDKEGVNEFAPAYAMIITDVKPPENDADLMDAGKWRITTVTTGDERARTYTMRSLMSSVGGEVRVGEITNSLLVTHYGPYFSPGLFGVSQEMNRNLFELAPSGRRNRTANVLTGNMYLAAEWSAAVNKGTAINYTDDTGQRHRVIQLPSDMDRIDPAYLPVRIADAGALEKFIKPIATPVVFDDGTQGDIPNNVFDEHHDRSAIQIVDTSFKSAMAVITTNTGVIKRDAVMAILPGQLIAFSCSPKDARRIRGALSSGQNACAQKLYGPDVTKAQDTDRVTIKMHTSKKEIAKLPAAVIAAVSNLHVTRTDDIFGVAALAKQGKEVKAAVISITAKTPGQIERVVELISKYTGLELYAATSQHKQMARAAIREVMAERRRGIAEMHAQTRQQIEAAAAATSASSVAQSEVSEAQVAQADGAEQASNAPAAEAEALNEHDGEDQAVAFPEPV